MKDRKNVINSVVPGSIAEEAGIEPGDGILSINGETIHDIFDYRFHSVNEELLLEVEKPDGEIWEVEIDKDEYEDLGLEFESSMIDEARSCTNKCIFCFIDQLPGKMRETLYFKDDDSRLSFLTGNYVTLTNISWEDINRIIRYRMSPINVSVHTTNPDLRAFMLKNRFAGDVLEKIRKLVEGGITVNCQIVLCRNINDKEELDKTISDLTVLYPGVYSVSVVPVGLTRYREGLSELVPFDAAAADEVISQVEFWQQQMYGKYESRVVYLADEFYIMARRDIPLYGHYEDFPQIENGVGLIAMLRQEVEDYLAAEFSEDSDTKSRGLKVGQRAVSIATGMSSYIFIKELAQKLEERFKGLKIQVYPVKNLFFGGHVTVTGLLTGQDLVDQLKGKELGEQLLICRCMLKAGEEVFLDDYTVERVSLELGVKISAVDNSGSDFIEKVLGRKK